MLNQLVLAHTGRKCACSAVKCEVPRKATRPRPQSAKSKVLMTNIDWFPRSAVEATLWFRKTTRDAFSVTSLDSAMSGGCAQGPVGRGKRCVVRRWVGRTSHSGTTCGNQTKTLMLNWSGVKHAMFLATVWNQVFLQNQRKVCAWRPISRLDLFLRNCLLCRGQVPVLNSEILQLVSLERGGVQRGNKSLTPV